MLRLITLIHRIRLIGGSPAYKPGPNSGVMLRLIISIWELMPFSLIMLSFVMPFRVVLIYHIMLITLTL